MTYRQGIIYCGPNGSNGAGGINVAWALINTLGADMINTGWIQVTTQNVVGNCFSNAITAPNGTIGPNSTVWNVYQSPGLNNSIGNTWHLAFGTDVQTNTKLVVAGPFMTWNLTGANLAQNYIPANNNVQMTKVAANGFALNTSALGGNTLPTLENSFNCNVAWMATQNAVFANTPNTFGTAYFYSVTIDRIIISAANVTPGSATGQPGATMAGAPLATVWYLGMYDTVLPSYINPNPLIMLNTYSQQVIYQPGGVAAFSGLGAQGGVVCELHAGTGGGILWSPQITSGPYGLALAVGPNQVGAGDVNAGGPMTATPFRYGLWSRSTGAAGQLGAFLGFMKDMFIFPALTPNNLSRGDIIIMMLDGVLYNITFIGTSVASYSSGQNYQVSGFGPWMVQR